MISVVLPTYNGEKYIEQSIKSILYQTYTNWELIVVDDCSTDSTLDIVKKYARIDERITVLHNSQNQKLPQSLNIGFEKARGSYFTWTSDDNVYDKRAFENMRDVLRNKEVDFVFSNYKIIDPDDYVLCEVQTGPVEEIIFNNIVGACFLYDAKIHKKVGGYDINRFLVEDYDFWLKVYWNYKMYHIDKSLYFYRIHRESLTAKRKSAIEKEKIRLIKDNLQFIRNSNLKQKVKKKIESKI